MKLQQSNGVVCARCNNVENFAAARRIDLKIDCIISARSWIEVDRNGHSTVWSDCIGQAQEVERGDGNIRATAIDGVQPRTGFTGQGVLDRSYGKCTIAEIGKYNGLVDTASLLPSNDAVPSDSNWTDCEKGSLTLASAFQLHRCVEAIPLSLLCSVEDDRRR